MQWNRGWKVKERVTSGTLVGKKDVESIEGENIRRRKERKVVESDGESVTSGTLSTVKVEKLMWHQRADRRRRRDRRREKNEKEGEEESCWRAMRRVSPVAACVARPESDTIWLPHRAPQ